MDVATEQDELLEVLSGATDVAAVAYFEAIKRASGRPNSNSMCLAGVFDLLQRYAEDLREMGMTRSTINNHME
jgi:hypothetical protein